MGKNKKRKSPSPTPSDEETAHVSPKKQKRDQANSQDDDFVELFESAQKLKGLNLSTDLLTKADLKNYVSEISPKPLRTIVPSETCEYESSESDDDFISPTDLLMSKIHISATIDDIKTFVKDKSNLEVTEVLVRTNVDEKVPDLEFAMQARIGFRSKEDLKQALKLNGEVIMGKGPIFMTRAVGRLCVHLISGFKRHMSGDDAKQQIDDKFKDCHLQKIILPKNQENGLLQGFAYIIVGLEGSDKALSMDSTRMGKRKISVTHISSPRFKVFKALMQSDN